MQLTLFIHRNGHIPQEAGWGEQGTQLLLLRLHMHSSMMEYELGSLSLAAGKKAKMLLL